MDIPKIHLMGFMMEQALGAMTSKLAEQFQLEGLELPHSQYSVLRAIYSSDSPLTQIQIAEILKKDAAAIKRTVDILERKGFVIRKAQTGRSNYVVATDKALNLKATITKTANNTLKEIFNDFSDSEVNELFILLDKIASIKND